MCKRFSFAFVEDFSLKRRTNWQRRCSRLEANPEAKQPASRKVKNTSPGRSIRQTRAGSVSAVPCRARRSFSLANKIAKSSSLLVVVVSESCSTAGSLSDSLSLLRARHSALLLFMFKMGAQERQSLSQSAPSLHPRSNQSARCHPAVVPSPDAGEEGGRDTMLESAHLSSPISFVHRRSVHIFQV